MARNRHGIVAAKQDRASAFTEWRQLVEKAEDEQRGLTQPEREKRDAIKSRIDKLDAQINDLESVRSQALAGVQSGGLRGSDREYRQTFADEVRDLTTGGFGGSLAAPDYQDQIWDFLRNKSVFMQTGPTVVETEKHQVIVPARTADYTAGWVAEAGTISSSDQTGTSVTVTPSKLAALTKVSTEAVMDGNLDILAMAQKDLELTLGLGIDLAAFYGTGASNQPTGLANQSGIGAQSMGTNGAAPTNLDFLKTAMGTIAAANADMSKAAIVINAHVWSELAQLKDSQNRYLLTPESEAIAAGARTQIDGVPVYVTNQIPQTETQGTSNVASSAFVYDASQVIVVRREALRLEITRDAYFSTDEVGLRGIARLGFAVPNPTAVVRVKGIL